MKNQAASFNKQGQSTLHPQRRRMFLFVSLSAALLFGLLVAPQLWRSSADSVGSSADSVGSSAEKRDSAEVRSAEVHGAEVHSAPEELLGTGTALFIPFVVSAPTPTPSPTPSITPSPTVTPSSSPSAQPSAQPSTTPATTLTGTPTATRATTGTPTRTATPTMRPGDTQTPTPTRNPSTPSPEEWTQHGHDAQRTSYTLQSVSEPWYWRWVWNGSNSSGGISAGKTGLPRNVQPVTGAGRVYVAAGDRGVYALNLATGAELWNARLAGSLNSTAAYDAESDSLFVVSSNGTLYRLNAASGAPTGDFAASGNSTLPLPPALVGTTVFFAMGTEVYAVNKNSMALQWSYDAGSAVETPPSYSASRNRVFVGSADLYVHAIEAGTGARAWRVRPVSATLNAGETSDGRNFAEYRYGWPVVADNSGVVLMKVRLDWDTMWTWNPWPVSNAQMRANLASRPEEQALFALSLDSGGIAFATNIGHGGYGDNSYMPMGSQPVVRRLANGSEVAYLIVRGGQFHDARWDSAFGEMLLDDDTVPGHVAGDVRYIAYDNPPSASQPYLLTDEQPMVTMAGNYLFGGHWEAGLSLRITDRGDNRGAFSNRIVAANAATIVTSQDNSSCAFSASHYCASGLFNTRLYTPGFYIYYGQGAVYDRYWGSYATWIVSNETVLFRSNDGAIVALSADRTAAAESALAQTTDAPASPSARQEIARQPWATTNAQPLQVAMGETRRFAGRLATVEAEVQYVFNNGKQLMIGFANPHQGYFKVLIKKEDLPVMQAAGLDTFTVGERIRATGVITWYQGDPVIRVTLPDQIRRVSAQALSTGE